MTGEAERTEAPSFGEAINELEEILQKIEGDEIDIDELAGELKRAAGLLELCRGKIRKAELEVNQIVEDLDAGGDDPRDEPGGKDQ